MENVEQNCKERTCTIDSQSQPPHQLLPQFLLEVLQHEETNREAGKGSGQVGHVGYWRNGTNGTIRQRRQGSVAVINGESHVHTRCKKEEEESRQDPPGIHERVKEMNGALEGVDDSAYR